MIRWLLFTILSLFAVPAWGGTLVVDILDVGQGDAILIRTHDKTVLIDAGDRSADTVSQLKVLGVDRLDLVVASHPHADHIGRMAEVLETFDVGLYMDNGMTHTTATYNTVMDAVERQQIPYRRAERGMVLNLGTVASLTVRHPGPTLLMGTRSDLNSNSVVLELLHEDVKMLFTGDAEEPTERALLAQELGQVALLKVAHHGSGHSTSLPFLKRIQPEVSVISCGKDNRYKHPYPETIARLANVGSLVFRTDTSGHVQVISDGTGIEVLEGAIAEISALAVPITKVDKPVPAADPVQLSRRERRIRAREERRQRRDARKQERRR